ncbi:tyrosine/serine/threonine protein phosphatase [Rhizina undulata]
MSLSLKRPYPFCKSPTSPASPFSSIFERDVDMSGCSSKDPHPNLTSLHNDSPPTVMSGNTSSLSLQHPALHQHGSVSTSASSSTNSSPTTTISTVESETIEERSPSSASCSPVTIMPLSSFKSQNIGMPSADDLSMVPPSPHPGCTRSISPSKKPRNTKNLSLNVPPPTTPPPTVVAQPPRSISAPTSPAFIVPPPPQNPRRRPSNLGLTIKLPGTLPEKSAVRGPSAIGVSGLRHHQSSPSLSLFSPAPGGIPGGMKLPPLSSQRPARLFNPPRPSTRDSFASSISSSSMSNSPPRSPEPLQEMDEEYEEPRSGEAKSPAYPAGPICIFEPNIYLYAEPDAELASKFDLVINVAREVPNPFRAAEKQKDEDDGKFAAGSSSDMDFTDCVPPDTACTDASFVTAFEEPLFSPMSLWQPSPDQTPKYREPEYLHMPWDHNTPILDDLPKLVNLIDERASAGKKVLVHCQCGVSRSATLLIAYAMFKSPGNTMQESYSAVKAQSRWIGPNMSLIYQLTDWKKKISNEDGQRRGGVGGVRGLMKGGLNKGYGRKRSNTGPIDDDRIPEPLPEPQTAPLPETRSSPAVSPMDPGSPLSSDHPVITRRRGIISASGWDGEDLELVRRPSSSVNHYGAHLYRLEDNQIKILTKISEMERRIGTMEGRIVNIDLRVILGILLTGSGGISLLCCACAPPRPIS